MGICLSHISAEEFLRYVNGDRVWRAASWNPGNESVKRFIPNASQINRLAERGLGLSTMPMHALVPSDAARSKSRKTICHVWSNGLPSGSVIQIEKGLYTVVAELAFIQKAHELSLPELIKQGYESCGDYRTMSHGGFRECNRQTDVASLRNYIERADGVYGRRRAARAARYIANDSRSPMETATAMLLCLPMSLGGYGIPLPQLNGLVEPKVYERAAVTQDGYHCDLYWPQARLALEYDSNEYHTQPADIHRDARRRNSLGHLGVYVITLTYSQIARPRELDEVALQLARRLNMRLRPREHSWWIKHAALRALVLKDASR